MPKWSLKTLRANKSRLDKAFQVYRVDRNCWERKSFKTNSFNSTSLLIKRTRSSKFKSQPWWADRESTRAPHARGIHARDLHARRLAAATLRKFVHVVTNLQQTSIVCLRDECVLLWSLFVLHLDSTSRQNCLWSSKLLRTYLSVFVNHPLLCLFLENVSVFFILYMYTSLLNWIIGSQFKMFKLAMFQTGNWILGRRSWVYIYAKSVSWPF